MTRNSPPSAMTAKTIPFTTWPEDLRRSQRCTGTRWRREHEHKLHRKRYRDYLDSRGPSNPRGPC
jgi:hypothetical protein